MKMFSDCSGPCVCCTAAGGGCLAGHGDDHFHALEFSEVEEIIKTNYHTRFKRKLTESEITEMKRYMKNKS